MALSRNRRDSNMVWPGFVDAVTTLLMVLMFVLTIFIVMQSVLQEQISSNEQELGELTDNVAALSQALGLERRNVAALEGEVGSLRASLDQALMLGESRAARIAALEGDLRSREGELSAARGRIDAFEAQVAALILERDQARGTVTALEDERSALQSRATALDLALASARKEIDASAEAARLDAARSEALEALLAELRAKGALDAEAMAEQSGRLAEAEAALSREETARLADAAALQALRDRLSGADTEITAMTLALEAERKRAEETLTLLAAARAAREGVEGDLRGRDAALVEAERRLTEEGAKALAAAREVELLNQQLSELRRQLGGLQAILGEAEASRDAANMQLQSLGNDLNAALAQVAAEQRRRAELEIAERQRIEAEKLDLERYRSEFFGQLSQILQGRDGVRVVGDRFVFSSEVLFQPGAADLAPAGQEQIASVARILSDVASEIPAGIDWIIRVDGHTDNVPLLGTGAFKDNWELSQARALSVVRYMQDQLGFPPSRLAATGFGEFQPVAEGNSEAARAQNRRIELKLTER